MTQLSFPPVGPGAKRIGTAPSEMATESRANTSPGKSGRPDKGRGTTSGATGSESHEYRFMREDKQAILSTAVGIARLRFRLGDVRGASDALDDAVDRCHQEHWDACLADGYEAENIERLLGPRDEKVDRVAV